MATTALPPPPPFEEVNETRLDFPDNRLLIDLCGEFDRNLAEIEHALEVQILRRGNALAIVGDEALRGRMFDGGPPLSLLFTTVPLVPFSKKS